MKNRKRILLDCDGVLSDFCAACFDLIYEHTGDRHTLDEVKEWDLFSALGKSHLKDVMKKVSSESGWCLSFPLRPGAKDAVQRLQEIGEVVIITSPMNTPFWTYERNIWLEQHFGIKKSHTIHTESKHYVPGDILVDDNVVNCINWKKEYPEKLSVLWDAPYNKPYSIEDTGVLRLSDWNHVFELLEK